MLHFFFRHFRSSSRLSISGGASPLLFRSIKLITTHPSHLMSSGKKKLERYASVNVRRFCGKIDCGCLCVSVCLLSGIKTGTLSFSVCRVKEKRYRSIARCSAFSRILSLRTVSRVQLHFLLLPLLNPRGYHPPLSDLYSPSVCDAELNLLRRVVTISRRRRLRSRAVCTWHRIVSASFHIEQALDKCRDQIIHMNHA